MGRGRFLAVGAMATTFVFLFFVYRSWQVAEQTQLQYRPRLKNQYQWKSNRQHPKDITWTFGVSSAGDNHNAQNQTEHSDGSLSKVKVPSHKTSPHDHGISTKSNTTKNIAEAPVKQEEPTYTYEEILQEEQDTLEADQRELDIIQQKQEQLAEEKTLELKQELAAENGTQQEIQELRQKLEEQMREDELKLFEERRQLAAERQRLEEDKQRFEEQLRQLRELSRISEAGETSSTEAPRVPPEYWEGLTWEDVHYRFPGILLLQDYKPRNFYGESGTAGKEKAAELASLLDVQAEDRFYNLVTVPHIACQQIQRMGNQGDGGWDLCVAQPYAPQKNNCIVYSFGINNDFSFDDDIAEKLGCEVESFDPSMSVGDHLHAPKVHFYQLGIGSTNVVNADGWKLVTLQNIMTKLGHQERTIDVLKMDIEFNEWKCLQGMLNEGSLHNVKQLIFEIHTPEVYLISRPSSKTDYFEMHSTLFKLEQQGFRRFHYHFNPYGKFTSIRSGKMRTCCYELYYLNIQFMKSDRENPS